MSKIKVAFFSGTRCRLQVEVLFSVLLNDKHGYIFYAQQTVLVVIWFIFLIASVGL